MIEKKQAHRHFLPMSLFCVFILSAPILHFLLIHNAIQQLLAGIFEQRDDEFKVAVVAVIRVGHAGVFTMGMVFLLKNGTC